MFALPSWLAISPQKKWSGLLRPLNAAILATLKSVRGAFHRSTSSASSGCLGEQAKADEQMRFAAAHRLFEMEDRLGRDPGESCDTLGDEILHALGDVRLLEKRRRRRPRRESSSSSCSIWSLSLIESAFAWRTQASRTVFIWELLSAQLTRGKSEVSRQFTVYDHSLAKPRFSMDENASKRGK